MHLHPLALEDFSLLPALTTATSKQKVATKNTAAFAIKKEGTVHLAADYGNEVKGQGKFGD